MLAADIDFLYNNQGGYIEMLGFYQLVNYKMLLTGLLKMFF